MVSEFVLTPFFIRLIPDLRAYFDGVDRTGIRYLLQIAGGAALRLDMGDPVTLHLKNLRA